MKKAFDLLCRAACRLEKVNKTGTAPEKELILAFTLGRITKASA